MNRSSKLLILVGSPRRAGNSTTLAEAVQRGAEAAGTEVSLRFIDDFIASFLWDCCTCRLPNGECAIADQFRTVFFDDFLPADGVIFCAPIYWYGLSAQTKAFFDRTFCYYAASYPDSDRVLNHMSRKQIGLVLASEETYPGASLGIVHQIQEFSRYTHSEFVGVVRGVGNSRGEVMHDPSTPSLAAEQLGHNLFDRKYSDYRIAIVFDPVSGPYLEKLADIVAAEGLIVEYGWLAEGIPVFPVGRAIVKGFRVQGFHLGFHVIPHPERFKAGIDYINQRLQTGVFRPLIAAKRFALDQIVDAYRYMESNEQMGKIVVSV